MPGRLCDCNTNGVSCGCDDDDDDDDGDGGDDDDDDDDDDDNDNDDDDYDNNGGSYRSCLKPRIAWGNVGCVTRECQATNISLPTMDYCFKNTRTCNNIVKYYVLIYLYAMGIF